MAWSNNTQLSPFDVLQTQAATSNFEDTPGTLGTLGWTSDGRRFRLGFLAANGTTLAPCKNTQGPAQSSINNLGTVSAQSIGDTQITYTFTGGAQTTTLNQYAGGYISIATGTGSPIQYQISGSPVVTSSTTIVLTLQDPIVVATTGSVTANLWVQPYSAVIISPTTLTGTITGVPLVSVVATSTLGTFFWAQTGGLGTCLGQGTTTQGLDAAQGSVAGSLAVAAATTQRLASADMAGADGLYTMWKFRME